MCSECVGCVSANWCLKECDSEIFSLSLSLSRCVWLIEREVKVSMTVKGELCVCECKRACILEIQ